MRRQAFTLVELLVVVAIITVLIAILLPALSAARQQSLDTKCLTNVRQVGVALLTYTTEWDGWLPGQTGHEVFGYGEPGAAPNAMATLLPNFSTRKVLYCPVAELPLAWGPTWQPTANSDTNYFFNGVVLGRKIVQCQNPCATVFLQENYWRVAVSTLSPYYDTGNSTWFYWHSCYSGAANGETYTANHKNYTAGNICFVDSHAEMCYFKKLHSGDFGLKPNQPYSTTNQFYPDGGGTYQAQ